MLSTIVRVQVGPPRGRLSFVDNKVENSGVPLSISPPAIGIFHKVVDKSYDVMPALWNE